MKIVMVVARVIFENKNYHETISSYLAIYRSLYRLTVDDLNFILNNSEKLENLPDPVVCNVVYRLSLTIQTQGKIFYLRGSIFNTI
jgi:hypothetical protein